MSKETQHCSFVLLAEFDIEAGASLTYQFPQPLKTSASFESLLAHLMLPDGAEKQTQDWTVFFLNQTPFNTIAPPLALDSSLSSSSSSSSSSPASSSSSSSPNADVQSTNGDNGTDAVGGGGSGDGAGEGSAGKKPELLHVLNLVRTKHDKREKRGGVVKAMAICTRHPFIQIFKPVLLMALDDYFANPSQDCLARLFDAINSMDLSSVPALNRWEKLIMRSSERKDLFSEKFAQQQAAPGAGAISISSNSTASGGSSGAKKSHSHAPANSVGSFSSFEESILAKPRESNDTPRRPRAGTEASALSYRPSQNPDMAVSSTSLPSMANHLHQQSQPPLPPPPPPPPPAAAAAAGGGGGNGGQHSPTDSSFSLDGSAVWVEGDSTDGTANGDTTTTGNNVLGSSAASIMSGSTTTTVVSTRGRSSTDASSASSKNTHYGGGTGSGAGGVGGGGIHHMDSFSRTMTVRDTHFYQTTISYKEHKIPIILPLTTFMEEVGDYSLNGLITMFSSPNIVVTGPLHPHLHTNGASTHPIILLFNGLITGKRILFLGHNKPAGELANYVLSACALGSGCGAILRGFIERAFPYATLSNTDQWGDIPGFIAGITNPIIETSVGWDLLFDVGGGRVAVHKDIHINHPSSGPPGSGASGGAAGGGGQPLSRTAALRAEGSANSEEEMNRNSRDSSIGQRSDFASRPNDSDNLFVEDLNALISAHYGENLVRLRLTEYVTRFVRIASRWEEDMLHKTQIGYPSNTYNEWIRGQTPTLGSGLFHSDDLQQKTNEIAWNSSRIDGWRKTNSYQYCVADFKAAQESNRFQGVDLTYQVARLRLARAMTDGEVELMMRVLQQNTGTYEQVVELLAHLTPQSGGILPLTFGLFHQNEGIRELTVDVLDNIRAHNIGYLFLKSLNYFPRYAYIRQASARESKLLTENHPHNQQHQQLNVPPFHSGGVGMGASVYPKALSSVANRSEVSLSGSGIAS